MVVNKLDTGGLEKVVVSLLAGLDRSTFTPHLVCLAGPGAMDGDVDLPPEQRLVLDKNARKTPGLDVSFDARLFFLIRRFLRARDIDVLHTHNLAPLVYGGGAAHLIPPGKRPIVIYSEHNQIHSATPGQRARFPYFVQLADEVIAVSRDLEHTLQNAVGVSPSKMRVIYNGIDGARFHPGRTSTVRAELGMASEDFVFGTAVVLSEQKGITYLLDAAKETIQREPRARFVLAGDGPLRATLEQKAARLGLGDRFRFLGFRRDVPDLLAAFDAYVLPSLWEGLPLALLEALAMGRPIVCTRVGGNPEIVDDGVTGFIVPAKDPRRLADVLVRVAHDRAWCANARDIGPKVFAEQFSLNAMIERHEQTYRELDAVREEHPITLRRIRV